MIQNSNYFAKRFEILENVALEKGTKLYEELEKQYTLAYSQLEKDILKWYNRFAVDNNVSFLEAKKMLTAGELKEFKWSLDEYIEYAKKSETNLLWQKQLQNASTRVHISRLDTLRIQIQNEIEKLYDRQLKGMTEVAETIYEDNYYHTAYELQKGNNVAWKLKGLDNKAIVKVLSKPWTDGSTFSEKIWENKQNLIETISTGLVQNFIRGNSSDELIKTVSKKFNTDLNKAGRLIMTESAFFASESQKDCFNDLGVQKYKVLGTLDSATCSECGSYDLQEFDMKDYEQGITAPPFHPWCRCTTIPSFEDEFEFGERAARDTDGNTYYVPKNISYNEWKEKYVISDPVEKQKFEIAQKKMKNKSSDFEQYKKYKDVFEEKEIGKTFEKFQEMKYNNNSNDYNILKSYYKSYINNSLPNDLTYKIYKDNLSNKNWQAVGFNPQKLDKHYTKHSKDFDFSTKEEYQQYAKDFMNKKENQSILSFKSSDGHVFKYDSVNNVFGTAKANGITETCFKPTKRKEYWEGQVKKYGTEKEM